ncbi:hypothetical protein FHS33_002779 [Streptomyces calvus]|uniref:Uncharacterized protein n=1 Tax=Streptomyces calvus TaxID=67282 RepID=A0AA40SDU0_9ACTN|nr:hypothetical protein [Streptomyces calvus]
MVWLFIVLRVMTASTSGKARRIRHSVRTGHQAGRTSRRAGQPSRGRRAPAMPE